MSAVVISYKNAEIASMDATGVKTLLTGDAFCEDDIIVSYTAPTAPAPALQTKSVTPTESVQTVTPDSGYDGLSQVNVGAIASDYVGSGVARKSSSDLTASGATVTAPAGYYAEAASKTVASGSASTPATTITANPSISVSASGLITASVSGSKSVTPTVSAGYVSSGTAGTVSVSGSNTNQLTTKAAQTYTPTTIDQTIASGKYLTGVQTIKGDANLLAENIADGVTIFGVTGTHSGGGGGGTSVTTVTFGDDALFVADDVIIYLDGTGTMQTARELAIMSETSYQMISGSLLFALYFTDPDMSGSIMGTITGMTRVSKTTYGSSTSKRVVVVYQVD